MTETGQTIEILQRLTRIETLLESMGTPSITANEALISAREANRRLDKYDKILFWATTTIIGAVMIAGMAVLLSQGSKL